MSQPELNHNGAGAARPRGIVWLASYPRSGNTWVRIMISNLVNVLEGVEGDLDLEAMNRFGLSDADSGPYDKVLGRPAAEAPQEDIIAARPKVLRAMIDASAGLLLVKSHFANVNVAGVQVIDPDVTAAGIYLVRNPLDVAVSYAAFRGATVDDTIEMMGQSERAIIDDRKVFTLTGSWSVNVQTWTAIPSPALLVLRYEDMLADPVGALAEIAAHVKMSASEEAIEEAVRRSDFQTMRAIEDRTGFSEKPRQAERFFRSGKVGQWRTKLTPAQIDRIVDGHNEQMARFRYLPQAE